jgi:ferredoxin
MNDLQNAIRQEAARLLSENSVDVVIGFESASVPLRPQPAFIKHAEDAEKLVYNGFCQNNLATFLNRYPKQTRVGLVARGCESRAAYALMVEHQRSREHLVLIGVPCEGILDWRKVELTAGENILSAEETDGKVKVSSRLGEFEFERAELLHDSCARCVHPNPVNADIILGEAMPEGDPALARKPIEEFEALNAAERYAYFTHEAERCIRCYACREACPMCYCAECFVDHTTPRWAESTIAPSGTHAWHLVRAFHQTGRCVSCGACERACPMDIKMTYLTDKLNEDMRSLYGFEVGQDENSQPPFAAFSLDDKDRFVS